MQTVSGRYRDPATTTTTSDWRISVVRDKVSLENWIIVQLPLLC